MKPISKFRVQKKHLIKKDFRFSLNELENKPHKIFFFQNFFSLFNQLLDLKFKCIPIFENKKEKIKPLTKLKNYLEQNLLEDIDPLKKDLMKFFLIVLYQIKSMIQLKEEFEILMKETIIFFVLNKEDLNEKTFATKFNVNDFNKTRILEKLYDEYQKLKLFYDNSVLKK